MRLQAVGGFVVERFGGRVLDSPVYAFGLTVGPGVVGLGQPVPDAVFVAHAVERVLRRASGAPGMVSHLVEAFLVKATPLSVGTRRIW